MTEERAIPPVDPTKASRIRKLLEPVVLTGAGRWWVINVAPPLDRALFRLSGGRLTSLPASVLFLTHTGARTGQKRETPLVYFTDGDDVIVMASNYGRERHPAWFYNVKANPEVELRAGGCRGRYRASVTTGEDRERLWALAKQVTRAYANYEERAAGRTIQVVRLTPIEAEAAARA
jgi:deazaflavin-dependent oxidoreductase (nitroreductase family)